MSRVRPSRSPHFVGSALDRGERVEHLLAVGDDLLAGHGAGQAHIAGEIAETLMNRQGLGAGIQPKEADRAAGGANEIEHAADGRGFARAVGAKEAKDFAALHLQRDVAHGAHATDFVGSASVDPVEALRAE